MSMLGPRYGFVAALLTRMSTAPNRSTVAWMQASACSGSPALAANVATLPSGIVAATSSRASALRADSMTLAPAAANDAAMAAPIPRDAPVTTAVLPSRLISVIGDLQVGAVGLRGGAAGGAASWSARRSEERGVDDLERVA